MEKRSVWYGILVLTLVVLLFRADSVFAKTAETALEPTVVTATKTEKAVSGIAASVTVITAEDIRRTGAATLKSILEKTPGLTLAYGRFPHSSSKSKSAISIRGMGGNGTLILVDGRRLGGETESPYEMDRIPAAMIERIEIVKGPMSTLYGSDAMGGVINIITRKPDGDALDMGLELRGGMTGGGDREDYGTSLHARGSRGALGYVFYAAYNESNPFTEMESYRSMALHPGNNQPVTGDSEHGRTGDVDVTYRDEAEVLNTGFKLSWDATDALRAALDVNVFQEDREGFYRGAAKKPRPGQKPPALMILNTPVRSVDDNERLDYSGAVEYRATDTLTGRFNAYRSAYEKRNRTTALNFAAPVNRKFSADVDITGYEAETTWAATGSHLLVGGGQYREVSRDSCAINPDPTSFEFVNDTQRYKALYLQDEWRITDTLNAILGMRYDDISHADNEMTFKAGLVKSFSPLLRVRLNYAEGYRAPDTAELYVTAPSPGDIPRIGAEAVYGPKKTVHTLDPEALRGYEVGIGGDTARFNYAIALFFNDAKDKIELERIDANGDGKDDYQTYVNKSDVETRGLEVSAGYDFGMILTARLDWLILETEDKETGRDLLFNPERTLSLDLDYRVTDGFSLGMLVRHVGEQDKSATETADAYTVVDVSFSRRFDGQHAYELFGGVNNILYEGVDRSLGSDPGPFFYAGVRFDL